MPANRPRRKQSRKPVKPVAEQPAPALPASSPRVSRARLILQQIAEVNERQRAIAAQQAARMHAEMSRGLVSNVGTQAQRLEIQQIRKRIEQAESTNEHSTAAHLYRELARKQKEYGMG